MNNSNNQFTSDNGNQIIKKESLYTGFHNLGNGDYNIEILISTNNDLIISA